MSALDALLDQVLGQRLAHCGEGVDGPVWEALTETLLTRVGIDESLGGAGGNSRDAATITTRVAQAGVGVPLTENLFVAGHLAARSATPLGDGIVTVAAATAGKATETDGGFHVAASGVTVPWGEWSDEIWLVVPTKDRQAIVRLVAGDFSAVAERNLASEPRDRITVDAVVAAGRVRILDADLVAEVELYGALGRSCQILGALRTSLDLTLEYVLLRRQFGKPLAAHQVVRHELAAMAAEVSAVEAAVVHAVYHLPDCGSPLNTTATLAVAAAKVQASTSATKVARVAHQMHGAVGLTAEHPLHHVTTRLWAWRDEFGTARDWSIRIAQLVHAEYGADLWAALTAQSDGPPPD